MASTVAERGHRCIASGLHSGVCDPCIAETLGVNRTRVDGVAVALAATARVAPAAE